MKYWVCVLLACAVVSFSLAFFNLYQAFTHPIKFEDEIITYCKEFDLNPTLVLSVINIESSFNENAKSNKEAIGLMQVKLSTANYMCDLKNEKHLTEEELFLPSNNIKCGCAYLRYLLNKYPAIDTALASYNAGETIVRSWLNSSTYSLDNKTLHYIPYKETRNYVKKVRDNMKFYEKYDLNNY